MVINRKQIITLRRILDDGSIRVGRWRKDYATSAAPLVILVQVQAGPPQGEKQKPSGDGGQGVVSDGMDAEALALQRSGGRTTS